MGVVIFDFIIFRMWSFKFSSLWWGFYLEFLWKLCFRPMYT